MSNDDDNCAFHIVEVVDLDTQQPIEFYIAEICGHRALSGVAVMEALDLSEDEMRRFMINGKCGFPKSHDLDEETFWFETDVRAWAKSKGRRFVEL